MINFSFDFICIYFVVSVLFRFNAEGGFWTQSDDLGTVTSTLRNCVLNGI